MTAEEKIVAGLRQFADDVELNKVPFSCPVKRPNRIRPIHNIDKALQAELDAWEAASDEDAEKINKR